MSNSDDEEKLAEAWLRAQGYGAERPLWLPSRYENPDFWAECATLDPPRFWAEAKSISPDDNTAALDKFSRLIRAARIPPGLHGHAVMEIDPHAIEQSVRWVLKCVATRSSAYAGKKVSLVFLQQTRDGGQDYRVEIEAETPILVWARADELPLNPSTAVSDKALYATARVRAPDGSEVVGPAYRFFGNQYRMQCVLTLQLDPKDKVLERISYMSGGSGKTRERTISALKKANSQISTACKTREAPGLAILTSHDPSEHNEQMMQAAIYGQYTVRSHLKEDRLEHSVIHHDKDGVFRPDKNTHISAVVYVRRDGSATFFPNPYALHPIPDSAPLFMGAKRAGVEFV